MNIYCQLELISGFKIGFELAEDEFINYLFIDIGIIRFNFNWDK